MDLSELLKKDLVEEFQSSKEQIRREIENAEKRIKSAEKILGIGEWGDAHAAAYAAMLYAGRALMFSKGYRPKGPDHHVAVVSFSQIYEKKYPAEVLEAFDKGRKRRHEFQYDDVDVISEGQAKNLVENAKIFVSKTKEILKF
ncbi:MAG: HEPN domain-containing protein [Nitrosopumilaceae archaeon]|nr:HEPN domain-containing protein [Nitrosopumilaceae archaeon]NIU87627.1 HEPN domain-containing protein [Nitrosopumilaceae archaeon]NIV66052.1 HEPN domain-containing protein [Nitrosopumilaceae archaeon]